MRARWAAFFERSLGMEADEADVVAYGLYVLALNSLSWGSLAALAALGGVLGPALWAGLVAASVRIFAGGAHAGSPARCLLISALTLVGLSLGAQRAAAWPAGVGAGAVLAAAAMIGGGAACVAPADLEMVGRLALAGGLGALFLLVQGYEWARLVHFGLTVSSGTYGATFYTLIGAHAVHVLAALLWLAVSAGLLARGRLAGRRPAALRACALYWHFVVALWPVLYVSVYLL